MTIPIADWAIRATPRGRPRLTAGHKQTAGCAFSLGRPSHSSGFVPEIERIDPTIAAHMPVVVTDLPVALLATTAVLWSYAALSSARIDNILAAGFSLALTLMAKYSGLVVLACVTTFGVFLLIRLHQCGLFYVQITSYRTAEHDCDLSVRAPHLLALACSAGRRMFG